MLRGNRLQRFIEFWVNNENISITVLNDVLHFLGH